MAINWIENKDGAELPKDGELCWVAVGMTDAAGRLTVTDRVVAAKCSVTVNRRRQVSVTMFVPLMTQYDMHDGWPIELKSVTHFALIPAPELPKEYSK